MCDHVPGQPPKWILWIKRQLVNMMVEDKNPEILSFQVGPIMRGQSQGKMARPLSHTVWTRGTDGQDYLDGPIHKVSCMLSGNLHPFLLL